MALFPIIARLKGDFVPHLVAVCTEDTSDQIAQRRRSTRSVAICPNDRKRAAMRSHSANANSRATKLWQR